MQDTLQQLIKKILDFDQERGWRNPEQADVAKAIMIEAAELLEHYQWDVTNAKHNNQVAPKNYEEIGEEAADVFIYIVKFCDVAGLDLAEIVEDKIKKNDKKYPAEMFKEGHNEEFYREQKKKFRNKKTEE